MGLYTVKVPFVATNEDGSATFHKTTGRLIALSDETATAAGVAVERYDSGVNTSTADPIVPDPQAPPNGEPATILPQGDVVTPDGTELQPVGDQPTADPEAPAGGADTVNAETATTGEDAPSTGRRRR